MLTRNAFFINVIVLQLFVSPSLPATMIDETIVPEVLPATEYRSELYLNGAAKRKFFSLIDVYVGSLYVENPSKDPEGLIRDPGSRRMVFQLLRSVRGGKIADIFYEGLRLNLTPEEAESMKDEINLLVSMFDRKVKQGDTCYLEYIPGVGMEVNLSGDDMGIVPGKDLFDAILAIWIGKHPISQKFKYDILGSEPPEKTADAETKE